MKLVPLKDLGSINTGNTPSKKERKFYEAKDIPFIKPDIISDSKLSEITHTEEYISNLARNNARIIPKNSILVTCIGSIGKIGITGPGEYAFNQQINAIVPNDGINVRYFAYCLLFNKKKLCEIANNAVVPIINKKQFSDFCVNINPDIKVQKDIVRTLDILACIIKHRQSQLMKLDELVKCRFVEMFGDPVANDKGWPIVRLDAIADIRIGPFGSLLHKEDYQIGNHALVNPSHIVEGKIKVDSTLSVSNDKYNELSAYWLNPGDIVMGRRGEMGRCAVVEHSGLICGTGSLIIRTHGQMKPYFLQNILSRPEYKKIIEVKAVGVTMMNLNVPIVSSLEVPLLPQEQQIEFLGFTHRIDKLRFVIQQSLDETQKLFDSLMQEYFD